MTTPTPDTPAAPPPQTPPPASRAWIAPLALMLAALAVLAVILLAIQGYSHATALEVQLARRIGEFDAASREARAAAKAANEALADLGNRLASLEARALETQNQQLALAAMYQELADSADERVVADIEQTLLLAQQQLQLAGNIKAALIGLQAADDRLSRLGKPQFAVLRRAIVQDMERLKLMPEADIEGLNARIEALLQGVDALRAETDPDPAGQPHAKPSGGGAWASLSSLGGQAWQEIKSLLRIRRLDNPQQPMLAPEHRYFLLQNLRLRLLSARLSLLQRDEKAFRADLDTAIAWVDRYFMASDPATGAMLKSLTSLRQAPVAPRDARLQASLAAVQVLRGSHP